MIRANNVDRRKTKRIKDSSVSKDAEYYDMGHSSRGLAIIFNQENFSNPNYYRKGSRVDRDSLERTFSNLGFEVVIFNDLGIKLIKKTILNLSKMNFSDSDCFVMVFMSHGLEGKLLAYDGMFDINILWDHFTGDQCPTLVNKPKLFFIQACQGSKSQGSVNVEVGVNGSNSKETIENPDEFIPSYKIPNRADFLVALATIPGYLSWRNSETGTYFIQALCENLDKDGFTLDLLTLLTRVTRRVAIDFEQCTYASAIGTCSKQLPTTISMLIRTLKFTDKKKKKDEGIVQKKKKKLDIYFEELNGQSSSSN